MKTFNVSDLVIGPDGNEGKIVAVERAKALVRYNDTTQIWWNISTLRKVERN